MYSVLFGFTFIVLQKSLWSIEISLQREYKLFISVINSQLFFLRVDIAVEYTIHMTTSGLESGYVQWTERFRFCAGSSELFLVPFSHRRLFLAELSSSP